MLLGRNVTLRFAHCDLQRSRNQHLRRHLRQPQRLFQPTTPTNTRP